MSEKIALALLDVVKHVGRWEQYLLLFPSSDRLQATLVELFANIISFLVRARIYYQKPTAGE